MNNKQERRVGLIKSKMETQFIINWNMDTFYKDALKCISVQLSCTGFAFINDKLRKKQREKIKTDLSNGECVVYEFHSTD